MSNQVPCRNNSLKRFAVIFGLVLALFAAKAGIVLNGGLEYGRLAMPPVYDDVVYQTDGMKRLAIFREHGTWSVIKSLNSDKPHAPYSTIAAFLAFVIAGPVPSAPYFANAIVAAFLVSWLLVKFKASTALSALVSLILVSLPWFDHTTTIFHPDLIAGLGTAVVAGVLVWQHETIRSRRDAFSFGLAAGLVLLAKPVAIVMIGVLWVAAFGLGAFWQFRIGRSEHCKPPRVVQILALSFLGMVTTSGWYLGPKFSEIAKYIYLGFALQRDTWALKVSATEHALYFAKASWDYFRFWIPAVPVAFCLAAATTSVVERRNHVWFGLGAWLLIIAVAYVVPSLSAVKTVLFGAVIYGTLVVGLVVGLVQIERSLSQSIASGGQRARALRAMMISGTTIIVVCTFASMGDRQLRFPQWQISEARLAYDQIYAAIARADEIRPVGSVLRVFEPSPGNVPSHAYPFRAMVDGRNIDLFVDPHGTDIEALKHRAYDVDLVILPDDRALESYFAYPVNRILNPFREWMIAVAMFEQVAEVPVHGGKVLIFQNNARFKSN